MKITKRHLKKVIREAIIREARKPMTPDYVLSSLTKGKSVRTGVPFLTTAMDGIASGDFRTSANAIMDALWIDDPPMGAEKELEDLLVGARTEDDVAAIGAEWGTRHFRTSPHIG
jgi:hypothetical protein|tara:strand:- start:829 stop:1173 length:345 start_codon:yes stop_codon:yes gene_type:complete